MYGTAGRAHPPSIGADATACPHGSPHGAGHGVEWQPWANLAFNLENSPDDDDPHGDRSLHRLNRPADDDPHESHPDEAE